MTNKISCNSCGASGEEPCRDLNRRTKRYMHPIRYHQLKIAELNRKRMVRENYLGYWLREYGSIFEE